MKNLIKILIILMVLMSASFSAYGQFIQNSSRSLYSDVKAFQIGDALMILIVEDTRADNSAETSNSRDTELSGGVSAGSGDSGFDADASLGTSNDFRGTGKTQRSERIRSKISARVVEVEDNGNMLIEGTRTTKINGETQTIVIKGVVRPVDVMPDNSVYSFNILDLTLIIEGDGSVSEVQEPGLLTKFFRILF